MTLEIDTVRVAVEELWGTQPLCHCATEPKAAAMVLLHVRNIPYKVDVLG